ncbi:hypothetical protein Patl1_19529 [Pistacia atlantica]|uniref:Uncharacterized protein n=1 Tax=Pistacia atlantica TaxID=434234 RepID=A0ACC1BXT1_9ROSI|nr:hypothetical protein Patl1_19529 [Pistacia atlantica]
MAMTGFLAFSATYIEVYYMFGSVWGLKIYTIYSILFIVFIILLIVTAFFTVASFLCGGSTGLFIYAYCLYYYFSRSGFQVGLQFVCHIYSDKKPLPSPSSSAFNTMRAYFSNETAKVFQRHVKEHHKRFQCFGRTKGVCNSMTTSAEYQVSEKLRARKLTSSG